jgi:hypothetical protein
VSGPRVVVTIDEVRLHGFDPRERAAIGAALARELEQRFVTQPPVPIARSVHRIDAGAAVAPRSGAPAGVAAGIAAGVHREVKRLC